MLLRGEEGEGLGIPGLERLNRVTHEISEEVTMLEPADELRLVQEGAHHLIGRAPQELGIAGQEVGVKFGRLFKPQWKPGDLSADRQAGSPGHRERFSGLREDRERLPPRKPVHTEVAVQCKDGGEAPLFGQRDQRRVGQIHRETPVLAHQGCDPLHLTASCSVENLLSPA